MELNYAILCNNAFVDGENRVTIVEAFDKISVDTLPAILPRLTIVSNYTPTTIKEGNFTNKVEIVDPKKKTLGSVSAESEVNKIDGNGFISYFYDLKFKKEGKYKVKISGKVNDSELETQKIITFKVVVRKRNVNQI